MMETMVFKHVYNPLPRIHAQVTIALGMQYGER